MYKEKLALYIALVTLTNGWVSTKFLEDKNKQLQSLVEDNRELKQKLDKYETEGMIVTVTMYEPVSYQTDSTPNILADGTRIRVHKASEYRFIAVSRNLLTRYGGWLDYGDFILLKPAFKLNTLALWLLPFVFVLVGIFIVFFHNKKSKKI